MPDETFVFEPLIFEAVYDDEKDFWFTDYEYNAFFKMNPENMDVELVGIIPHEKFIRGRLYSSIAACNGKLYFAPFSAKEIAEYDPEKKKFRKIPVPIPEYDGFSFWENEKFFRVMVSGEKVYFIPWRYPGVLCYDTRNDTITLLNDWVAWTEKRRINTWGYFSEFVLIDYELILPCACADAIIIFNTITDKLKYVSMPAKQGNQCRFSGICYVKPFFYLVSGDGTVVKRKLETEVEITEEIIVPASDVDEIAFYPVRFLDDFIYLFPFEKNDGFRIDVRTERVEKIEWFSAEKQFDGYCFPYLTSISRNGKLYAMDGNKRQFIEYGFGERIKREFRLLPSESHQRMIMGNKAQAVLQMAFQGTVVETAGTQFKWLLEGVKKTIDFEKEGTILKNIETGMNIYATLKNDI